MATTPRVAVADSVRAAAEFYLGLGFVPVPVPRRGRHKAPDIDGWQDLRPTAVDLDRLFPADPEPNVGLLLGAPSGGLIDVDLDCDEAVAVAHLFLPETRWVSGRPGRKRSHHWYVLDDPPDKASDKYTDLDSASSCLLELRSTGGLTVAPPGVHETGERLHWFEIGATPAKVELVQLQRGIRWLAVVALLVRHWPGKGARQDASLALAGGLLRAGWEPCHVELILRGVALAAWDDEVAKRVAVAAQTAKKLADGKNVTGWPRLVQLLGSHGDAVVRRVRTWLGLIEEAAQARPRLRRLPPYRPFPIDALPGPVRCYVREAAAALGCDPAYVALPALAVIASAIGNTRTVRLKRGWDEPAIVWAILVGDSGTLKSPAYLKAVGHLFRVQDRLRQEFKEKTAAYQEALYAHQAARAQAKKDKQDPADAGEPPEAPTLQRVVCSDTTVEKLAELLEDNPRGLLLARDELAAWLGSFCRYKGRSGGTDLPNWLEVHRAGNLIVDRKTSERQTLFVPRAAVSITGGIQPGILARALTDELLDSGLAARLLLAMPPRRAKRWTEAEIDPATEAAYQQLIEDLIRLEFAAGPDREPYVLGLSPAGKAAWVAFYNAWATEQAAVEGELAAAFSKLEGYAARLALVHHVAERVATGLDDLAPVGPDSVAAGVALCRWFADEARRVYATLSETAEEREMRQLLGWIADRGGRTTVKQLQQSNGRKYPDAPSAQLVLDGLVEAGYGCWVEREATIQGGRPTRDFVLHPPSDDTDETPPGAVPGARPVSDETPCHDGEPPENHGETKVSYVSSDRSAGPESRSAEPGRGEVSSDTSGDASGVSSDTSGDASGVSSDIPAHVVIDTAHGLKTVLAALPAQVGPVVLDLETTGLDPRTDRVRLLSLGLADAEGGRHIYLIDCARVDPTPLWPALAQQELIAHNAAFDLQFLARLGFEPGRAVHDTMLLAHLLVAGTPDGIGLADCCRRWLEVELDKGLQTSDWGGPLSDDQLAYAARDVAVLPALLARLTALITEARLDRAAEVERCCLPAVAWMAHHGVGFDADGWAALAADARSEMERLRGALDRAAPVETASNLFPVECRWNWDSHHDVRKAFALLGVTLSSTDDDALAAVDHDLARLLRAYREQAKRVKNYGGTWLGFVHDGRLHPGWRQVGTAAGRMSCTSPNVQQMPRGAEYRRCITAPPGRVLVKADYSQIELRVAARVSGDKALLEAYQRGEDLHTRTARQVLGREQVTKQDRQLAKACFSGDTEILTPAGWVRFDAYDGVSPVAQFVLPDGIVYNPPRPRSNRGGLPTGQVAWDGSGGTIEFVVPLDFRSFDEQPVWHVHDRNIDLVLTADHEVIFLDTNQRARKLPLADVEAGHVRHVLAAGDLARRPALDEAWTRVLAMVVADGSFKSGNGIRLGFSKPRKVGRCGALLTRAGIPYRVHAARPGDGKKDPAVTTFVIGDRAVRECLLRFVSVDKDLHWSCLSDLDGRVYLEEASCWDGHRIEGARRTRVLFSTTRRQTAEVMQALAATSGIPSTARHQAGRGARHSDLWHLSYPLGSLPRWRASWRVAPAGRQTVFCVQVPAGALVVRRNGKVAVMGNCNFGLVYGMGAKGFRQYAQGQYGVALSETDAQGHRRAFFRAYPGLAAWHHKVGASTSTETRTLSGRRRLAVTSYTRKLNSPVQGTGADGLKLALALLWERRHEVPGVFPVLAVHDEIVVECDAEQADVVAAWLQQALLDAMGPLIAPVPVEVEVTVGRTWAGD